MCWLGKFLNYCLCCTLFLCVSHLFVSFFGVNLLCCNLCFVDLGVLYPVALIVQLHCLALQRICMLSFYFFVQLVPNCVMLDLLDFYNIMHLSIDLLSRPLLVFGKFSKISAE